MRTALIVGVGGGVLLLLAVVALYNRLVRGRNRVQGAWSQIDVQLTRRSELIPNLVETARAYAAHERSALEAVVAARSRAVSAERVDDRAAAESALSGALGHLFALAEGYPDLKADRNFLSLQEELTTTESRVAYARQYYNDVVSAYNSDIQVFPSMLLAPLMGFRAEPYFQTVGDERWPLRVKFS